MKLRAADRGNSLVPVPRMLGAFLAGGLVAALAIPALYNLMAGRQDPPSVVVLFLIWIVMIAISGAYLFPMSVVLGFRRDWYRLGLGCLAALELILFVLLPMAFSGQKNLGIAGHASVGAASLVLALVVFGQIAKAARRYAAGTGWPVQLKAAIALIAGVAGLLAQVVSGLLLGLDPAASILSTEGVATVLVSALSGYSLAEALDRSTRQPMVAVEGRSLIAKTIRIGVGLLMALHLIWFVYVERIF